MFEISPQDWGDYMRSLPMIIMFVGSILLVLFIIWCCDPDKFWKRKSKRRQRNADCYCNNTTRDFHNSRSERSSQNSSSQSVD